MLRFYLGASGAGKSTKLYQEIIERSIKAPEQNFFIIVPDQFTMQTQMDIVKMHPVHGIMNIDATIICERDSHKGIIIGKSGSMLKRIGTQSRIDIEKMVEHKVNLQIWVKVRKNWRDDMLQMKNLGYDMKNE